MSKIEIIKDLLAAYPHFNPPDLQRTLTVYMRGLRGFEEYQLRAAVDYLIQNAGRFFPTVSDIAKTVRQLDPQPPRVAEPVGDYWQAMGELREALQGTREGFTLPASPRNQYSGMSAQEVESLADAKAAA